MAELTLKALYRYPVKSLRGEEFQGLDVVSRGFRGDREWMLIDEQQRFLTLRQLPRMALISARIDDDGKLRLSAPEMADLTVDPASEHRFEVEIWGDLVAAAPAGAEADSWLSGFLGRACRLVSFPSDTIRRVDPDYAGPADQVGFADGFPFMLISQASLDDLNGRLQRPVSMLRFRPNLVVAGCDAFAEDDWRRIRIGELIFTAVKPCSRCIVPTIDPLTGERGKEPIQTLMTYRRRGNKVYFGQNLVHEGTGTLAVGMPVEVLD